MPPFNAQRTVGLLERALTAAEPTAALQAITALRVQLDALERQLVVRALREGTTFSAIAAPLGISRQAAHRRYRDLKAGAPTTTLSAEVRAALMRAREEAKRHGSHSIGSKHLLLALADCGVLEVDTDRARRSFGPPTINAQTPRGLDPALHARLSRAPGPLQLQDLLRATLADAEARDLLNRFGAGRRAAQEP